MNEKIKQLAKQSYFHSDDIWIHQDRLKRFSDLIIRECMDVVKGINQEYDCGSTVVNAAEEIKSHFGIEE